MPIQSAPTSSVFGARRLVTGLVLVAALAACGPSSNKEQSQWLGASRAPSAPGTSGTSGAPSAALPSGNGSSAATLPSPRPGGSPSSTGSGSALPPPGKVYEGRLPKFGKPPKAERVSLEGGDSAAYFSRIPTTQPVAFLTIDDGWIKRPEALELFRESGVAVTLFLTINAIDDDPAYFKRLQESGAVIEAHTISHPNLRGKPYSFQHNEICGSADRLGQMYGRRPVLFRPPFGEKDETTLKVAHDCGLKAGFFWKETVDKGIVRFQEGHTIQAGDVILMHFRDRFVDDFIAALQAISAAGLTPALLEDYIP